MFHKSLFLVVLVALLASVGLSACSSRAQRPFPMAEMSEMPPEVQQAPAVVQEAYRFAAANPDVLTQIPCYCGCGGIGHTSNYACYVAGENADGSLQFDGHALGCSICVDITQDAMRMLTEGKSVTDIRAYVDRAYSRFGPSNMP